MKKIAISTIVALGCLSTLSADTAKPKMTLKPDMVRVYNVTPGKVDNIVDVFKEGMFYGHLRANWFRWDWDNDDDNYDNKAFGLGGDIVYKTASLYGFSAGAGMYYSKSPFSGLRVSDNRVGTVKSGKDTFSRADVRDNGNWHMATLAQAYLQYDISKTTLKYGRQLFESMLVASNDTKMQPNAFEGFSLVSKDIPDTTIKAAYFYAQKLRDHTKFHDVIANTDSSGDSRHGNDDNGAHQGLSYANLKAKGKDTENKLVVIEATNTSVPNLKIDLSYNAVPHLVSNIIGELNYGIDLGGGFKLTPGVRYFHQFDNGAGEVGGAALTGKAANGGYKDPTSLKSDAYMGRLVLSQNAWSFLLGYSKIADKADLVAPWRGFPTGGYTRGMAQMNWSANTKSYMAQANYDFGKAKILDGFKVLGRFIVQDFDEKKQVSGVAADSKVIHIDLVQQITPELDARFRFGSVRADKLKYGAKAGDDNSYNEYRLELNYFF